MYLITLYFDKQLTKDINNLIIKTAKTSDNDFMISHHVPAHLTLLAFDIKDESLIINKIKDLCHTTDPFNIEYMSAGFFPSVLYITPIVSYSLQNLLERFYNELKDTEGIIINPKYQPHHILFHTTIAKTLNHEQLKSGMSKLIDEFYPLKGIVTAIGLSKTNPYQDLYYHILKEHQ